MPSTLAWLLLAVVLTTLLAVGRWTQQPTPTLAGQPAPARPVLATRRVAAVRPALPHTSTHAVLTAVAL
ncbi:MAG: hypothetical protein EOO62_10515 [Hymenobacter sp.]|nr:MAG: hypothetical protein EOO62_10515 [Hymenobacter sp.]